ncbi:MAG: hypothetical protein IKY61_07890 [Thermoguttaceae bacterium]|nr:hypothetical protein [Thermoguttaceae bacterium]
MDLLDARLLLYIFLIAAAYFDTKIKRAAMPFVQVTPILSKKKNSQVAPRKKEVANLTVRNAK